jgi:hypothetical protein
MREFTRSRQILNPDEDFVLHGQRASYRSIIWQPFPYFFFQASSLELHNTSFITTLLSTLTTQWQGSVDLTKNTTKHPKNTTKTNWILHKHLNKHRNKCWDWWIFIHFEIKILLGRIFLFLTYGYDKHI